MLKYGFLVVEGQHDAEFVCALLKPFGLKQVRYEKDVPTFLKGLIPRQYPQQDGDLQKRMPTPIFLTSATHAITINIARGDSRLVQVVDENLSELPMTDLIGVGIVLDADKDKTVSASQRYAALCADLADPTKMENQLPTLPDIPGTIKIGTPHVGAYVLPDNANPGTLEDVLIECAHSVYSTLLSSAINHVTVADTDPSLTSDDLKDFKKPSGRNKAVVGSMASILRPGKAVQVSIQDNRWLRGEMLNLPRVQAVQDFLKALFEVP